MLVVKICHGTYVEYFEVKVIQDAITQFEDVHVINKALPLVISILEQD